MSGDGAEGGFLSRWSRRKRAAVVARPAVPAPVEPAPPEAPAPSVGPDGTPDAVSTGFAAPEPFDPADLPPVESLTADSDFTAFLRAEVPAALRRAALRRAWSLDPVIRDFVGPADYAWDFNAADGGMAGFSPHLFGDVKQLLAQAIGADTAPPDEAPAEDPEAVPAADAAASCPVPAPSDAPLEEPAEPPPSGPPPSGPPPSAAMTASEEPEPVPLRSMAAAAVMPVRRRHGGALPS
jgi:hypothetical protein